MGETVESSFSDASARKAASPARPEAQQSRGRVLVSLLTTTGLIASLLVLAARPSVQVHRLNPKLAATYASNRICSDWPVVGGAEHNAPDSYKAFVPSGSTITISGTADIVAPWWSTWDATISIGTSPQIVHEIIGAPGGPTTN
jgi:hypothetical protein